MNETLIPLLQRNGQEKTRLTKGNNICMRIVASIWVYSLFMTAFLLSFLAEILLFVMLWPVFLICPRTRVVLTGSVFRLIQGVFLFGLNPFWNFVRVRGPPKSYKPDGRTLIMLNHSTSADPWISCRAMIPWEVKYIYKAELRKVPVAGWTLMMSGDIPLYFTKERSGWGTVPGSVQAMLDQVVEMGEKYDIPTAVYPEGTRSRTGRLQLFKLGFFKLAIERNLSILPGVAHNGQSLWPIGTWLVGYGKVYFSFGDPIAPKPGETAEELLTRTRQSMIELIKEMPLYDPELDAPLDVPTTERGFGVTGANV